MEYNLVNFIYLIILFLKSESEPFRPQFKKIELTDNK